MLFNVLSACYLLRSHSYVLYLQQIQSNFIVVIHPGSTTLRIGRATDTLPASIPHVIARRHKQQGQPLYKDNWLLREGLNVSQKWRMLAFQWLGLRVFAAEGPGSIPGQGTKIPQATQRGQKTHPPYPPSTHTHKRNVRPREKAQGCLLGRASIFNVCHNLERHLHSFNVF